MGMCIPEQEDQDVTVTLALNPHAHYTCVSTAFYEGAYKVRVNYIVRTVLNILHQVLHPVQHLSLPSRLSHFSVF